MDRRTFLHVFGGAAVASRAAAQDRRPNLILLLTDDQRHDALSCAGNPILQTPNIDRLAAEGVRFTEAFCTYSLCSPSRASFLTGLYPHAHGVSENNVGGPPLDSHLRYFYRRRGESFEAELNNDPRSTLRTTALTSAELLKRAGYYTAAVGKWHIKSPPSDFEYSAILPRQGDYYDPRLIVNDGPVQMRGYVDDVIMDQAIEALKTRPPDRPFMLHLGFKAPHREWLPPKRYEKLYDDVEIPEPATFNETVEGRPGAVADSNMDLADLNEFDGDGVPKDAPRDERRKLNYQFLVKRIYRVLKAVDDNVGRLLDYLDEADLARDTLVVFASDNGFFLGEFGLYNKRMAYEPSIRIPMVARFPGRIEAGRIDSEHMVLSNDVFHTFLDYAGVESPAASRPHGRSWRPLFEERDPEWRKSILYQYTSYPEDQCVGKHRAVRTDRWKLIHYVQEPQVYELFDLENDPEEGRDLSGDPAYASRLEEMKLLLEHHRDAVGDDRSEDGTPTLPCERKTEYRWAK